MTLGEWLAAVGVDPIVTTRGAAAPFPSGGRGLVPRAVPAPDEATARLLAGAAAGLGRGPGASWDGETLTLISRRSAPRSPRARAEAVTSPAAFVNAFDAARSEGADELRLRVGFPLDAPLPAPAPGDTGLAAPLPARSLPADARIAVDLILAGGGARRDGGGAALRDLAERSGLGVLETAGGRGVFRWDSPFHLGVAGLQEWDLRLAGLGPDSVVLTVGVDEDECPPAVLRAAGVDPAEQFWAVAPDALPGAVGRVVRRRTPGADHADAGHGIARPLGRALATVVRPLLADADAPLNPARAVADLATVLPAGAIVLAEAGTAGLWVGRTHPATHPDGVWVSPAGGGMAVAAALLTARRGQVTVAIVEHPPTGPAATLLELASDLDLSLVVEVWGRRGGLRSAADHRERLTGALSGQGVRVIEVPVDLTTTKLLLDTFGDAATRPTGDVPGETD